MLFKIDYFIEVRLLLFTTLLLLVAACCYPGGDWASTLDMTILQHTPALRLFGLGAMHLGITIVRSAGC